ncbi:hypothetical protein L1987_16625 [Smallanthus sonchifolius]|uniref:Uncharacterized protein n=1 Tax=Smallanthus sonchifolius TaxID=185202 RepID=A0ACB9IUZ5_9ASTR|nr:hypothetical protein L1987_16625 [Smallanthus sonchifolius]
MMEETTAMMEEYDCEDFISDLRKVKLRATRFWRGVPEKAVGEERPVDPVSGVPEKAENTTATPFVSTISSLTTTIVFSGVPEKADHHYHH